MSFCITRNKRGSLEIEGRAVSYLAKRFGTPLFVVCEKHLRKKCREFKNLFSSYYPKVIVAYSYKTNYLPFICKIMKEEGYWAEVASSLELYIARKIGHSPQKIIFNGPAKTYPELLEAMKFNIGIINIDSLSELEKIIFLSKKYNFKTNIGIRINAQSLLKTRKWSKFGIDFENILEACKLIIKSKNLKYRGLQFHLGTQIKNIYLYKEMIKKVVYISKKIYEKYNLNTEFIDIGGGFPVETLIPMKTKIRKMPSIKKISCEICSTLKREISKTNIELPTLVLEPGRVLISSPIFLLLKVIATKKISKIGRVVITDGGLNILPESEYYKYEIIPDKIRGKKEITQVAGPLCMEEDLIGINRKLPSIHENDILVVLDAGGYSISLSWQFIKPRPAVILINSKRNVEIIRKPESFKDILTLDKFS
jgi:diaminopimelate decarboxylase